MADSNRYQAFRGATAARNPAGARDDAQIDAGLRDYMLSVYNYMLIGLGLTGGVAYFVGEISPEIYMSLAQSGLIWAFILAPLAYAFLVFPRMHTFSLGAAQLTFWSYAAVLGVSFGSIFLAYQTGSIFQVFLITGCMFGATSLYGYTTKRDLSQYSSFIMMGVFGVMIAIVVNWFMQSSALGYAISVIGVLVFTGLTAMETQRIKEVYYEGDDADTMGKKAIMGALTLYISFVMMFQFLLSLLGNRE